MKSKGILMNTEMVKAILAGTKTVTRRLIKPQPPSDSAYPRYIKDEIARFGWEHSTALCDRKLPYQPGDVLYVRETYRYVVATRFEYLCGEIVDIDGPYAGYEFKSGGYCFPSGLEIVNNEFNITHICQTSKWKPSIHMPKEAARIFLRVTDVRVEQLQDITDEQVIAEGIDIPKTASCEERCLLAFARYLKLWNSIIKKSALAKYGWNANPWVFVISFERVLKDEAMQ